MTPEEFFLQNAVKEGLIEEAHPSESGSWSLDSCYPVIVHAFPSYTDEETFSGVTTMPGYSLNSLIDDHQIVEGQFAAYLLQKPLYEILECLVQANVLGKPEDDYLPPGEVHLVFLMNLYAGEHNYFEYHLLSGDTNRVQQVLKVNTFHLVRPFIIKVDE